ncbi:hypothetical protein CHS0354_042688 [Potamilus streckersoni]|uniref:Uncharacterized protein n=1 Tax=Potamilus streckersoni TaxID=2493646 RepID=A0AAE0VSP2_9BIVA|nr:hypothetical protein CHS0354_042688 [Potamilus streckersoni]
MREVVSINRYLSDPQHVSQTGNASSQHLDVYELTITDFKHKTKVLLSSNLYRLVQLNQLWVGCAVKFTSCQMFFDEADLSGKTVIVVNNLDVTGHEDVDAEEVKKIPWCSDSPEVEKLDLPLTSSRGYYLSLWSSMEMRGEIWKTSVSLSKNLGGAGEKIYVIKEVAQKWTFIRHINPVLVVRVLLKSRVIHYAKPGKNDKWPFQAHLLVADESGACTAVLWNAMCPEIYHGISEGSILLLRKYNVKKSFQTIPRFRPAHYPLELYDIDININSHHPATEITILDPDAVPDDLTLPDVQYNFLSRKSISFLPDNFVCDVIGVVTYIGRYEREPIQNKHGHDSGGFWIKLWIHLRDDTSPHFFYIQLYRVAEGHARPDIVPGQLLVCRHLRVIQGLESMSTSRDKRYVYLTSTAETQVTTFNKNVDMKLQSVDRVQEVIRWSETVDIRKLTECSVIGGYFAYPICPSSVKGIQNLYKDLAMTSSQDWTTLVKGLSYRECRRVLVQAVMVQVQLKQSQGTVRWRYSITNRNLQEKEASDSNQQTDLVHEVLLNSEIYQSQIPVDILGTSFTEILSTRPVAYTPAMWNLVKQHWDFPPSSLLDQDVTWHKEELKAIDQTFLTISWLGLNSKVILQTLFLCPSDIPSDSSLLDLLSGRGYINSLEPSQIATCHLDLLETAYDCANQRFLLVLDLYQRDSQDVEIMLNRAVPLDNKS